MQTVALFVFDGLADWEASYAVAGINTPFIPTAVGRYQVQTVGLTRQPVRTMGGITIVPDRVLAEFNPSECALLILPGGTAWDAGELTEIFPIVGHCLEVNVPVAAICGATAGLARGGFLDTRQHTSNAPDYLQATGYRGAAHYRQAAVVTDGGIITAGAPAALAFAAQIFRQLDVYPTPVIDGWYQLFTAGGASQVVKEQS